MVGGFLRRSSRDELVSEDEELRRAIDSVASTIVDIIATIRDGREKEAREQIDAFFVVSTKGGLYLRIAEDSEVFRARILYDSNLIADPSSELVKNAISHNKRIERWEFTLTGFSIEEVERVLLEAAGLKPLHIAKLLSESAELSNIITASDKIFPRVAPEVNYKAVSELLQEIDRLTQAIKDFVKDFDPENPDPESLDLITKNMQNIWKIVEDFSKNEDLNQDMVDKIRDVIGNKALSMKDILEGRVKGLYGHIKPNFGLLLEGCSSLRKILQRGELPGIENYWGSGKFDISNLPEGELVFVVARGILNNPIGFRESWQKFGQPAISIPEIHILVQGREERKKVERLIQIGLIPKGVELISAADFEQRRDKKTILFGFKDSFPEDLPSGIQEVQFETLEQGELLNWERVFVLLLIRLGVDFEDMEEVDYDSYDLYIRPVRSDKIPPHTLIPVGVRVLEELQSIQERYGAFREAIGSV